MNKLLSNPFEKIRVAIQGDGENETQDSLFLNLHPKLYRYIFFTFILSYLITQIIAPNIFLQIYLILVVITVPGQAIMRIRVIDFKNSILNLFFSIILSLIAIMFIFLIIAFSKPISSRRFGYSCCFSLIYSRPYFYSLPLFVAGY